jgi:hypothetical protein
VKLGVFAGAAAAALAVALAGCTSGGSHALPSDEPSVSPSSSGANRPLPLASGTSELDICQALPRDTVAQVLGVSVTKMGAGVPGGTLLGECDYAVGPSPSDSSSTASDSASDSPSDTTSATSADGPPTQVYVSGRANSEYSTLVQQYGATPTTLALANTTLPAAFSPTAGLLVKVPGADYFLQIAVEDAGHHVLQDPAGQLATYYIAGE